MPHFISFEDILQDVRQCRVVPLHLHGFGECSTWEVDGGLDDLRLIVTLLDDDPQCIETSGDALTERLFAMRIPETGPYFNCPFTIVTGRLLRIDSLHHRYAASIRCVLYGVALEDSGAWGAAQENIQSIVVATPVTARITPSVEVVKERDINQFWAGILSGDEFTAKLQYANPLHRGDWNCGYHMSIGSSGISFNHMTAELPVGQRTRADGNPLALIAERIDAWRVLLTLLQGGGSNTTVIGASLRMRGKLGVQFKDGDGFKHTKNIPVLFPLRQFRCLDRLPAPFHRHSLAQLDALDRIGMGGVAQWCTWYADFMNQSIVSHWLHTDEFLGAFPALEGVGRRLARSSTHPTGDVHFGAAMKAVLKQVWSWDPIEEAVVDALNEANNKLVKHIGDIHASEDREWRRWTFPASRFAALLVGYALLKIGVGGLDSHLEGKWRPVLLQAHTDVADQSIWPHSVVSAVTKNQAKRESARAKAAQHAAPPPTRRPA